jgi:hypothetical protein
MSHLVRSTQYDWGYDWPDDCPAPQHRRVIFTPPPTTVTTSARSSLELPPCKPHGGINTDWSGNKCAELSERSSPVMLPAPAAPLQPPKLNDPGTVDQTVQSDSPPSSMTNSLIFDVAIGLSLAVAFVVVRRAILNMTERSVPQFWRDTGV